MSLYDYNEVILWIENKGIEIYGNQFKIFETDYANIHKLLAYFLRDEIACFQLNIDLNKGILLSGQ